MIEHTHIDDHALRALIQQKRVVLAGHKKNQIYGLLSCRSGKRMVRANRVFFASASEAKGLGFHPCGQCLKTEYALWRAQSA
jgi:methylphosphotriester-DNA--protein-cysteine methyltransferase